MKSSQSSSEPAAANKPSPHCAFSGCKVPPTKTCSRCKETQYCSKEHQTAHWKWYKKICVAPQKKILASASPVDLIFDDASFHPFVSNLNAISASTETNSMNCLLKSGVYMN
ncbi:hypothetical protein TrLO_g229 [Triparma laevis f. longispina]|uniref:MYND-type domain-containing protein n=1 Tax=Triparma laevis f. longispina TaxID=1714387 RepID=A0A9W7E0V8_9STRA|nr:hypothetical protein TrLO_g229 [Triparma laevis f. longispina]